MATDADSYFAAAKAGIFPSKSDCIKYISFKFTIITLKEVAAIKLENTIHE